MAERHDAESGFTLIELLVALVVLGAVMAGLAQGVRLGLGAWNRQAAMLGSTAELDALDRVLRTLIAQCAAGRGAGSGDPTTTTDDNRPAFNGGAATLAFDAPLPSAVAIAGRRAHVELLVNADHRFVLRWTSLLASAATGQPLTGEATLLTDVRGVDLHYFGSPENGKPPRWLTTWNGTVPPDLVRIHPIFVEGDRRRWPDLVLAAMTLAGAR
jgi:general secretion pathway protein J